MAGLDEVDIRQNRKRTNYSITYKMNEEVDIDGILEQELGPDEDDEEAVSAYALNRQKLNASRNLNPNRFQEQMDAIKEAGIDPMDPAFVGDFMFDMAQDAAIVLKSDNPYVAAQAIAARRLAKRALKELPKPNFIKQIEDVTSGRLFGLTGGGEGFIDPPPRIRKTPGPAEKQLRINKWVNDLDTYVDTYNRKGELIRKHISKVTPKGSGYDLLGIARSEWNKWSKRTGFINDLADKEATAFVEHLVGKDAYYDPFWTLPNHKRFRKGSRHGPDNVRILKNNRMKSFKDTSEKILKAKLPKPTGSNVLVFDYDIKVKPNQSIISDRSPGNLLLKRADGTVVGELGDYHDILYAPRKELIAKLSTGINPRTNRPYITIKDAAGNPLPEDEISLQIQLWRTQIIGDKIDLILRESPLLKGMTKRQKYQFQGTAIQDDMVDFLTEYANIDLGPAKKLRAKYKSDPAFGLRGGKPVKSLDDELEGVFLNKTQERQIRRAKLRKGSLDKSIRDLFDKLFPDD